MKQPSRPFGVTLAILASLFMFSIIPLLEVGMVLLVRQHFLNVQLGDDGLQPIAMGGDFLGVSPVNMAIQGVIGITFLIVGILAWFGRPASIRYVLIVAVLGLTIFRFLLTLSLFATQPGIEGGISSGDSIFDGFSVVQFVLNVAVMLYVVWYMNRGPARAFYRGYYLNDKDQT